MASASPPSSPSRVSRLSRVTQAAQAPTIVPPVLRGVCRFLLWSVTAYLQMDHYFSPIANATESVQLSWWYTIIGYISVVTWFDTFIVAAFDFTAWTVMPGGGTWCGARRPVKDNTRCRWCGAYARVRQFLAAFHRHMRVFRAAHTGWSIAWSCVFVVQAMAQLYIQPLDSYPPDKTLVVLVLNVVSIGDNLQRQLNEIAVRAASYPFPRTQSVSSLCAHSCLYQPSRLQPRALLRHAPHACPPS